MDARHYLKSFGWKDGDALQNGGIKKPILVKHKKDTKGLGNEHNDADKWWESLFDGQLKNLEVTSESDGSTSFKQNQDKVMFTVQKETSPLYRMFVKGEVLEGTAGKKDHTKVKDVKIDSAQAIEDVSSAFAKGSRKRKHLAVGVIESEKHSKKKSKKSKSSEKSRSSSDKEAKKEKKKLKGKEKKDKGDKKRKSEKEEKKKSSSDESGPLESSKRKSKDSEKKRKKRKEKSI